MSRFALRTFALVAAIALLAGCGGGKKGPQQAVHYAFGTLHLAVQPVLGGPTGDPEDIGKIWVQLLDQGAEPVDREFSLERLGDSTTWELVADQQVLASDYELWTYVFEDADADPTRDQPTFVASPLLITVEGDEHTSVLVQLDPRALLTASERPFIESVVVYPSRTEPRNEVSFAVQARGGSGRLSLSAWLPDGEDEEEPTPLGDDVLFGSRNTGMLVWQTPAVPGFFAVALQVEDEEERRAEVGVALSSGMDDAYLPLSWNIAPMIALSGHAFQGEDGESVATRVWARLRDDRSAELSYRWQTSCPGHFVEGEGWPREGSFAQETETPAAGIPFFVQWDKGLEGVCSMRLEVTDEEGARSVAVLDIDTDRLDVEIHVENVSHDD